ncbi:MAG: carbohydrate ABC transporter permease [Alphaproteobacteria bacterium]|nr:carbohydrate ABC transporter permease [Alphaproteobacteria bacterium]
MTMLTRRRRKGVFATFRYTVLTIWLVVVAFPLFWIVATSLKRPGEWIAWPPVWWSSDPTLGSYFRIWVSGVFSSNPENAGLTEVLGPWEALINTFIIAFTASTLATLFAAVIAYGASRYRILTDTQLMATLVLRLIPPFVIAGPLVLYFGFIGLEDTRTGLTLLYMLTTIPYALLVLKSFVDEIPLDYEQAAEILGASRWQVIWEIILPLLKPGLAVTFLFLFILNWSEFFLALILSKTDVSTLPMHLNRLGGSSAYGLQAALAVGATIPLIIIGLLIRKHLVRGLSFGFVRSGK